MFGPLGTFFGSLFSAELYHWAAHMRRGVGLSYLFGISALIVLLGSFYCIYNYGVNWISLMVVENNVIPAPIRIYFSVILPNEVLVYAVLPILSCFVLTLIFFNIAVISAATIGQAFNYIYEEPLEYVQVLRANCYIAVIASFLTALFVFVFPDLLSATPKILIGLIIAYNFYGILYPKFDL